MCVVSCSFWIVVSQFSLRSIQIILTLIENIEENRAICIAYNKITTIMSCDIFHYSTDNKKF